MKWIILMTAMVWAPAAQADWVDLFNGKDLEGWGAKGATESQGYVVKDGMIESTKNCSILSTEKEYADYILEFEFQLTEGANNGLGIHYLGNGNPAFAGMEVQILDSTAKKYADLKKYQFHGSLYTLAAAERGHLKPVGEWNVQRVTVRGDRVSVELNGVCILDENLAELSKAHPKHEGVKRRSGKLCFCGHGDVVRWRKLRIAELSSAPAGEEGYYLPTGKADESLAGKGFTALFDGKSLAGWKADDAGHAGHWAPKDGWILSYDGKSKAKDKNLWTDKEYKDFVLICDWRWKGEGPKMKRPIILPNGGEKKDGKGKVVTEEVSELDSGIYLRGGSSTQVNMWEWPVGSGEVYGIRTRKNLSLPIRAGVTPRTNADNPIGEWNRFVITVQGDKLTVYLNGEPVLHEAVLPGVKPKGAFALQHHGAELEFANLFLKEL